ncbi:DUF2779 domain-containing protein [Citromicrobium bathyomarinum]|uniref:DUF2779 domain-containing protein n=1 Tax=Citromicrobium bathyomarinum TaxID=72174 RepID=UPI00315A823D
MLTKTSYLAFDHCPKAFWVAEHRPDLIEPSELDPYTQMLVADGFEFERLASAVYRLTAEGSVFAQKEIKAEGCVAVFDLLHRSTDGFVTGVEIKSATQPNEHLIDAAYQWEVARRAGHPLDRMIIAHARGDYVFQNALNPAELVAFEDVTKAIGMIAGEISEGIDRARDLLQQPEIDLRGCSCRHLGNVKRRCPAFHALNPDIGERSAHLLPRISAQKLKEWDEEGRLDIEHVQVGEVTKTQSAALKAVQTGQPMIDRGALKTFLDRLEWPLYFYDYETTAAAIPVADGHRPHVAVPVQFSVHVLFKDGQLDHHEYLSMTSGDEDDLTNSLAGAIGSTGSCLVWNAAFEKGCNRRLAEIVPTSSDFLGDLNARTVDLMIPFKKAYVDPAFAGSVSIKKVLPALCPHLQYDETRVHDGAGAMVAWRRMIASRSSIERQRLAAELRSYCHLDTLAMVEIFKFLRSCVDVH